MQFRQLTNDEIIKMNEEEIQRREKETNEIMAACEDIYEITKSLHDIIVDQGEGINQIHANVENASVDIQKGNKDLKKAEKYSKGYGNTMTVLGFGALGFMVGGPIGSLAGIKFAGGALIGTALGGGTGHVINKVKNFI